MLGNILLALSSGLVASLLTLVISEWIRENKRIKQLYHQDKLILSEISLNLKNLDGFLKTGVKEIDPRVKQLVFGAIKDKDLTQLLEDFFNDLTPAEQLVYGTLIIELTSSLLRHFYGILLKFDEVSRATKLILQRDNPQIIIDYSLLRAIAEAHELNTEQMNNRLNNAITSRNMEFAGNIIIAHLGSIRNIYKNSLRLGENIETEVRNMVFEEWKHKYKELIY